MSNVPEISSSQRFKEIQINRNFETIDYSAVYGKLPSTTEGLTWGYAGGRWSGFSVAEGTLTLTNAATNYIVVLRSTGVISVSTTSTNWDNTTLYARVYKLTVAGSVVTATEDHRAGPGGVHGPSSVTVTGPTSSTDNAIVRFDGTTGTLVQNSVVTIGDTGAVAGVTTLSASGQITSTLATGTAPFSIASTTVVPNLNVSQLLGATWAAPGTIGSGTPSTGAFTTLSGTTLTLASGTIVDTAPAVNITQTWNDGTEAFTGALMNITDTASANGSWLARWQFGGSDVFGIGKGVSTSAVVHVSKITSTGANTLGNTVTATFPATSTTTIEAYRSAPTLLDGSGVTFAQVVGFRSIQPVKNGAGDTITKYSGFLASAATVAGLNIGFEGALAVSGTARYNLYMSGTAPNYLEGYTGIGATPDATTRLLLTLGTTAMSSIRLPHGAAPSAPVNGDMWTTTAGLFVRVNGATVGPLS